MYLMHFSALCAHLKLVMMSLLSSHSYNVADMALTWLHLIAVGRGTDSDECVNHINTGSNHGRMSALFDCLHVCLPVCQCKAQALKVSSVSCTLSCTWCEQASMLCRCVDRFDHHCPAICNCVGRGNQRAYTAWLASLLLAQILFLHLSCLFCARVARHHWNAAGQHDRGGFTDLMPALWLVFTLHPGKVLLIVIEVMGCADFRELLC